MRTFLINLDSRPDRLAFVDKQLAKLNLPYERIPAVIGSSLTEEEQKLFNKKGFLLEQKRKATTGEIGCAMSHRLIWKEMVDKNLPFALILEDDISIDTQVIKFLNNKAHYQHFDFLNLSSNIPYQYQFDDNEDALKKLKLQNTTERPYIWQSRQLWKKIEWRRRWRIFKLFFYDEDFTVCECDPAPLLGSGYILSLKGAESLLKTSEIMTFPIDLTWRVSGGRLRQGFLYSPLILQSLGDTNIEGRYAGYKLTNWQKVQRFFVKTRRIKRRWDVLRMYGWLRH